MKTYLYLIAAVFIFISCSNKTDSNFEPETEADIIQYIEDNNLNAIRSNSGLYYVINNEGSGARPTSSSNVTVDYKGYFLDGVVFDESDSYWKENQNIVEDEEVKNNYLLVNDSIGEKINAFRTMNLDRDNTQNKNLRAEILTKLRIIK